MHFSNYVVGLSDGILKQQKVTIENSIKLGLSIEQISQITNLNIDEINKIIDKKEE